MTRVGLLLAGFVLGPAACGFPLPADVVADSGDVDADYSDAKTTVGPNCEGLAATCGVHRDESCCTSLSVPGGTYYRYYRQNNTGTLNEMSFPATISTFGLDKYEVTIGRFRMFVRAGMGVQTTSPSAGSAAHDNIPGSGWDSSWNTRLATDTAALSAALQCDPAFQTWTDRVGVNETRPVNCITWYEAMAFCAWDHGYLPTEAEWGYAAAGGDQQRSYPWSDPPVSLSVDDTRASYRDSDGVNCLGDGMQGCAVTDILTVGARPAGGARWGHLDMGGNVFEMTLDWLGDYPMPCSDCANLTPRSQRSTRGGSYTHAYDRMLNTNRFGATTDFRTSIAGFRCARPPR